MLPKELLEVRKAKGRIFPKFADERDYELANEIIRIFKGGLGKKYGSVMKLVREIENAKNFKKVRGFVRVLENHCVEKSCAFSIDSEIEPKRVRMPLRTWFCNFKEGEGQGSGVCSEVLQHHT